jgi:hypothetical protein
LAAHDWFACNDIRMAAYVFHDHGTHHKGYFEIHGSKKKK